MSAVRRRVDLAFKSWNAACDSVYACAPNQCTPFSDCLKMAPESVRDRYLAARKERDDAESAAVRSGKAWRGTHGLLMWSR